MMASLNILIILMKPIDFRWDFGNCFPTFLNDGCNDFFINVIYYHQKMTNQKPTKPQAANSIGKIMKLGHLKLLRLETTENQ